MTTRANLIGAALLMNITLDQEHEQQQGGVQVQM
jgi:hypothetical protein